MTTKYNGVVQVCPMCDIADCRHIREAQESEPVGYTSQGYIDGVKNSIGDLGNFAGNFFKNKWQNVNIPLYAHPPAQESEPVAIYQIEIGKLNWVDVEKIVYFAHPKAKRIVYTHPPADKDAERMKEAVLKIVDDCESMPRKYRFKVMRHAIDKTMKG